MLRWRSSPGEFKAHELLGLCGQGYRYRAKELVGMFLKFPVTILAEVIMEDVPLIGSSPRAFAQVLY